ncbi:COG4 transport protein-domain-containing protein [Entophlyctis helioformis]|nr:COG4 transport protein-domain-containing protein [Entophlyctis helioformis]
MRVNFVATEQEYLAAAAAAEGEAVDGAAPEPLLQYLLHSVQRLQEGLEQIQEEQLQLQQLQQLQVRVAVLEGQAQWFRVIGQPRLYLHIARLNRQLQRQIRRLQQQQQQHEQEQEQELLEDAGIAGNANMDDVGWGMDAGDEFAEEAEIVEGVQAVIPAAVQAVIPAAVPAVVPAVIPAVVPAVVPVVVPAAAPAADVMTLLHQVLAGQEGLQAQFRVLDWRVQNHDAERYNSQNSILGTQMIRPLIKMRQGFTPDPRRVIPMGRGGRNILPGRDNIPAGVLPGPANVGFEFPASQSALQDLKLHADGLLTVIEKTWSVAQGISGKVRQLDLEQSRVKTTLQLLDDVQELKACAFGAQRAIARSDIETGADFIARFLRFNVEPVEEIFVHTMVMADDQDPGFMGISATDGSTSPGATLTNLLMDEFDAAVQANNPDEIVRCFKMFPQLGKAELGLDKFAAYVCGNISQFCHEGMRAATESNNRRNMYVDLITRLFEVIASMIDRQEAMVESHYGPGRMLSVIQRLQREADIQSSILIGGLMEARQLKRKVKDIQAYEDMTRRKHQGDAVVL